VTPTVSTIHKGFTTLILSTIHSRFLTRTQSTIPTTFQIHNPLIHQIHLSFLTPCKTQVIAKS
jgi:hypothetical protein